MEKALKRGNSKLPPAKELNSDCFSNTLETFHEERELKVDAELEGNCPAGDWYVTFVLLRKVIIEEIWMTGEAMSATWNQDISDPIIAASLADEPLVILLKLAAAKRIPGSAGDPYTDLQKAAAGTIDLLPLFLGQDCICAKTDLMYIDTGEKTRCTVKVKVQTSRASTAMMAVRITMLRAACIPQSNKSDTIYVSAIDLTDLNVSVPNLKFFSSDIITKKTLWASLAHLRYAAVSDYLSCEEDAFVDKNLMGTDNQRCNLIEWNVFRRVLVERDLLQTRLSSPILLEIAGVAKAGKAETRGHYMAVLDLEVLLQPGECSITVRMPIRKYDKTKLPEDTAPLMDLALPNLYNVACSAIPTELENIIDEKDHIAYVEINFDLTDPIVSETIIADWYKIVGREDEEVEVVIDNWKTAPEKPQPPPDARQLKLSCEALELYNAIDETETYKYKAKNLRKPAIIAQRLHKKTRQTIKEFATDYTDFEFLDIINGQHRAARRAVTSSFEPQPSVPKAAAASTAARARYYGNKKLADALLIKSALANPLHPQPFLALALRRLEHFDYGQAIKNLTKAVENQINNRYILWTLGALESELDESCESMAEATFRLAITDHTSDGTRRTIAWAALHAHYHSHKHTHAAFVAARNMRKASEIPIDWVGLLDHWRMNSGEEEHQWDPYFISQEHPLVMAAAMFLCLRAFKFVERLLQCCDSGCTENGAFKQLEDDTGRLAEVHYLRSASLLLQRRVSEALKETDKMIFKYGPSSGTSRLRLACVVASKKQWDSECEDALDETERFCAPADPALLVISAAASTDATRGLQRAARAHEAAPSAQSAVVISRLLCRLGRDRSAERWVSAAVGVEPDEPDAWAELARQMLQQQRMKEGRAALRSARQAGKISEYLLKEIKAISKPIGFAGLPELISNGICLCDLDNL